MRKCKVVLLAQMAGVTGQAVSRWEMGVSVPNINALILISEKFDIPVDEMLKSGDVVEKMISIVTMLPVPSGKIYQIKYRPLYTKLCRGSIIK